MLMLRLLLVVALLAGICYAARSPDGSPKSKIPRASSTRKSTARNTTTKSSHTTEKAQTSETKIPIRSSSKAPSKIPTLTKRRSAQSGSKKPAAPAPKSTSVRREKAAASPAASKTSKKPPPIQTVFPSKSSSVAGSVKGHSTVKRRRPSSTTASQQSSQTAEERLLAQFLKARVTRFRFEASKYTSSTEYFFDPYLFGSKLRYTGNVRFGEEFELKQSVKPFSKFKATAEWKTKDKQIHITMRDGDELHDFPSDYLDEVDVLPLTNHGDDCFANAVLQSLYALEDLRRWYVDYNGDNDIYHEVAYIFEKTKAFSVEHLRGMEAFSEDMQVGQQDAHEFLVFVTSGQWDFKTKQSPFTTNMLDFTYSTVTKCTDCGWDTKSAPAVTSVLDLDVEPLIDRDGAFDFERALESKISPELIDYKCENPQCFHNEAANTARIEVNSAKYLIIQLKLFKIDAKNNITKVFAKIKNFNPERQIIYGQTFRLMATVKHISLHGEDETPYSGHYVAYVRDARTSRWAHMNDSRVVKVTDALELDFKNHYLFFFERVADEEVGGARRKKSKRHATP